VIKKNYRGSVAAEYIGIFLISLIPLLWYRDGFHINAGDIDYGIFNFERLLHRLQSWDISFLGGTDRSNNAASLSFVGMAAFFDIFFDYRASQIVCYAFIFFINSLSIRYLLKSVLGGVGWGYTAALLIVVLFYNTNIYNAFAWVRLQINITTLGLIPGLIALYWNFALNKIGIKKAYILLFMLSLYGSPIGIQPPLMFNLILVMLILYWYLSKTNEGVFKKFLQLTLFYCLCSFYWAAPLLGYIYFSGFGNSEIGAATYNVYELIRWVSTNTSLGNIVFGLGDQPWYDSWDGLKYWPEFDAYRQAPYFLISSSIIFYITYVGFKSTQGNTRYFAICYLTMLGLSVGAHFPFEQAYMALVNYFPYFWIHRAPWQKFYMFTLIFQSVLLFFGINSLLLKPACKKR
jgi:hypothetical protein